MPVLWIAFWFASVAGFITHFFRCYETNSPWLGLLGFFIPPIGVLHGWGVWFGIW
jgi:hypothetical protein